MNCSQDMALRLSQKGQTKDITLLRFGNAVINSILHDGSGKYAITKCKFAARGEAECRNCIR